MEVLMPLYHGIEGLKREGDAVQWGGPRLGSERFGTPDGLARFTQVKLPSVDVPEGHLILTLRRGRQFNSMTYGDRDPLANQAERNAILLDPRDLDQLRLRDGDRVLVTSDTGHLQAKVRSGPCRPGHAQGYWPECNVLVRRKYDPESGEPDYNATIRIERVGAAEPEAQARTP
jgi:anaerobic selenocysteine-containing dehydrogenase